jgi:F420-non-reducing hydrogenase iron-sulfur subunit
MMCSGMVSPDLVVRALSKGADGVLVLGCHLGECHYMEGNFNAAKRMAVIRNLLAFTGIDPERLRVEWVSSAEAPKLVQIVTEFSNQIKALGPSPLKAEAC